MTVRSLNPTVRLVNPDGTPTREFYLFLQSVFSSGQVTITEQDIWLSSSVGGNGDAALAQTARLADEIGSGLVPQQITAVRDQVAQLARDVDDLRKGGVAL